jgi:hypothetical protein
MKLRRNVIVGGVSMFVVAGAISHSGRAGYKEVVMASTVKTAISMQEELFDQVNKLAEELHVSRSKLFVMAVQDFIKKNDTQDLLSQINKAFNEIPDSDELKVRNGMGKKQIKNLEREPW